MNAIRVTREQTHIQRGRVAAPLIDVAALKDRRRSGCAVSLAVIVLVAVTGGCGGGETGAGAPSGTSTTSPVPSTSAPAPSLSTPGQLGEPGFPYPAGSALSVVGVAHDDVLNVRAGPAPSFPVVATLGPVADGVMTTGRVWQSESWWIEVSPSGTTGWANLRLLGGRDGTEDVTSRVITVLGGRPVAKTMADLGRTVAASRVPGPEKPSIAMSVAPTTDEVTYDVVGLFDDSILAERLQIVGQPTASGQGFALKSVQATSFCARGAPSTGGLCP